MLGALIPLLIPQIYVTGAATLTAPASASLNAPAPATLKAPSAPNLQAS